MAKIMLPREQDCGQKKSNVFLLMTMSLVGAFGGIPIGALLSGVMQRVLHNSSAPIMYGFFFGPIILAMIIVFFISKKDVDTKNHTVCEDCKKKMVPMTEIDTLFSIPAFGDQHYDNPLSYLAQNMVRISSVHDIPENGRGCYVCCYTCETCSKRIVRVADFYPNHQTCTCEWKESYYFNYGQFLSARMKNDLL